VLRGGPATAPGRNILRGGLGFDRCYGTASDLFIGCEKVVTS
jgi:hypothetical protein